MKAWLIPIVSALAAAGAVLQAHAPRAAAQRPDAIAFIDIVAGNQAELFTVRPDGAARVQHTASDGIVEAGPSWAPDARRLAFSARVEANRWGLNVLDTVTGDVAAVTQGPQDLDPAWSPDGRLIAFAAHLGGAGEVTASSLSITPPDGIGARPLILLDGGEALIRHPTWSPDGRRIAFTVTSRQREGDLYVIGADGSDPRLLLSHPGWDDVDPAWSRDGTRLAFASGPWSPAGVRHAIWLVDLATGAAGTIASDDSRDLRRPAWSADGRAIVFDAAAPGGTRWDLHVVPADGGPVGDPLTAGREPDWAPAAGGTPTPTATPDAATPTASPGGPTPTGPTPTLTPPVVPTFPSFPTLVPFPTRPPPEPTQGGPAPTFPRPTASRTPASTATATAAATAQASPTVTAAPSMSPTAAGPTPAPGTRAFLPVAFHEIAPTPTATPDAPTLEPPGPTPAATAETATPAIRGAPAPDVAGTAIPAAAGIGGVPKRGPLARAPRQQARSRSTAWKVPAHAR